MNARKNYLEVMSVLGWFALIAQFILLMQNHTAGIVETVIRYFGFFTILSNILVATMVTSWLSKKPSRLSDYFSNPPVQTAITLYITVVGLVYNIILRQLWHPRGLGRFVDELLHTVIPILSIFYWYKWTNGRQLAWKNIPSWLVYPAVYALFILWRGSFSGYYPYPFLDVAALGYSTVLLNSVGMIAAFLLFSTIFILVGKKKI